MRPRSGSNSRRGRWSTCCRRRWRRRRRPPTTPDCRMPISGSRRVGDASGCPTVRARIVSDATVQILTTGINISSAPNDHFAAGPDCRMVYPGLISVVGWCPTVGVGIISPAGVSVESDAHLSAPDDHFIARRPHCGMKGSTSRRASCAGGCPTVGAGIIFPAGIQIVRADVIPSAPYDHFTAGPDCCVAIARVGRADDAGCCPIVGAGIVFPAGVEIGA